MFSWGMGGGVCVWGGGAGCMFSKAKSRFYCAFCLIGQKIHCMKTNICYKCKQLYVLV